MVEEISLQPRGTGAYRLYRLTKRGWGTEELVRHLARRLGLPRGALAYGGRKDRGAVTVQHLTIRGRRDRSLDGDGFELRSLGFVDRPMGPDAIVANRFAITLRGLDPAGRRDIAENLRQLARRGVPNYFDDQRFRSFTQYRCFPASLLIRGEWEAGLRLLLTTPEPGAPRRERERLALLGEVWGRWEECLPLARHPHERRALEAMARAGAALALAEFPRESLSMLLAAYQSQLWNRALAAAIARHAPASVTLPGVAGEYLFPAPEDEQLPDALQALVIPTPGPRLAAVEGEGKEVLQYVLAEEGITPAAMALRPLPTAFLRSTPRNAFVVPTEVTLEWLPPDADQAPAAVARLTFSLPPGAYATMVVRGALVRRRGQGVSPTARDR